MRGSYNGERAVAQTRSGWVPRAKIAFSRPDSRAESLCSRQLRSKLENRLRDGSIAFAEEAIEHATTGQQQRAPCAAASPGAFSFSAVCEPQSRGHSATKLSRRTLHRGYPLGGRPIVIELPG